MCLGSTPPMPVMPPMPAPPPPEPVVIVQPPAPTPKPDTGPSQQAPDLAGGKQVSSARKSLMIKRPSNANVSAPINTTANVGVNLGG